MEYATSFSLEHGSTTTKKARNRYSVGTSLDDRQMELEWTKVSGDVPHLPDSVESPSLGTQASSGREIAERAYPLVYDVEGPHGQALLLLKSASDEARRAIEAFNDADLASVGSSLSAIGVILRKCYPETSFNPALGAAISFVRRAVLAQVPEEATFVQLMALSKALHTLAATPLISLDESADLVEEMDQNQWRGENVAVSAFVSVLLGEEPGDAMVGVDTETLRGESLEQSIVS